MFREDYLMRLIQQLVDAIARIENASGRMRLGEHANARLRECVPVGASLVR